MPRFRAMHGFEPRMQCVSCTKDGAGRQYAFFVSCCRSVEMRFRFSRCSGYAWVTFHGSANSARRHGPMARVANRTAGP